MQQMARKKMVEKSFLHRQRRMFCTKARNREFMTKNESKNATNEAKSF